MIFRRDVKNRIAKKLLENVPANHYLPYPYQLDLLDTAYERNTIMCVSNELIKNFVIIQLIREMHHDHRAKSRVLYFTQYRTFADSAGCLSRHTGLLVAQFNSQRPFIDWDFETWSTHLLKFNIILMSPALIPVLLQHTSLHDIRQFLYRNFYLLIINECHNATNPKHPYSLLFGSSGILNLESQSPVDEFLRIVCFTSALLPRGITDPIQAEKRLIELEQLTNCRLETASELLTMLSLGARPKERVQLMYPPDERTFSGTFHGFVSRVLRETQEFLQDIDVNDTESTGNDNSIPFTLAPDSRGRMIGILDYCRRAITQCQQSLRELGVWCAAQVARVFVKHLVGLDYRRSRILHGNQQREVGDNQQELIECRITRLLRFTISQLCLVVRLFQTEFDTCMTYDGFKAMISPRILALIDLIKTYKPSMDFRIEIAELPKHYPTNLCLGPKVRRRRGRRRDSRSNEEEITSRICSMNLLSDGLSGSSDSSDDTLSSTSDQDDSMSSRKSSCSRNSSRRSSVQSNGGSRRKSKNPLAQTTIVNPNALNFQPAADMLPNGRFPVDIDPSQLVYRAVSTSAEEGSKPYQPTRMCGLVMVPCQFTAYALARLIDEVCVWDEDMFFVKPAHLFACQSGATSDATNAAYERAKLISNTASRQQTSLRTGDDGISVPQITLPATQEETISKFRRGQLNLLVATQAAVTAAAGGAELPRCNLVVSLQAPQSLAEYLSSKARTRLIDHGAQVVYLVEETKQETDETTDSASCENGDVMDQNSITHDTLARFQKLEQLLVQRCRGHHLFADEHDVEVSRADEIFPPFTPKGSSGPKLEFSKAINVINQYCARLPSDYITNLTPRWRLKRIPVESDWAPPLSGPGSSCGVAGEVENARMNGLYLCLLRLPINTSVKGEIPGHPMACKKLAKFSAAFNTIQALYRASELDSRFELSTKEPAMVAANQLVPVNMNRKDSMTGLCSFGGDEAFGQLSLPSMPQNPVKLMPDSTGRRRQYYFKKFADQTRDCLPQAGDPSPNYLYFIDMRLTNALPDVQNSRGRPCIRPEDEPLGFGLLTTKPLHHIPSFPIFSRSGEETVQLTELWSPNATDCSSSSLPIRSPPLSDEQLDQLIRFHRVVFQAVLRLEREAVVEFKPRKAYMQVLVVPTRKDTVGIDWQFISLVLSSCPSKNHCRLLPRRNPIPTDGTAPTPIVKPPTRIRTTTRSRMRSSYRNVLSPDQCGVFEFREEDFRNAVVMPSYRNLDQPQHYYVAEILVDLNPLSPFPSSTYANFATYYAEKYEAVVTTVEQPLLDVDFTAMRLNLLVPRYLNVRGHYLPCPSEARKRDRRENINHKQILIPELCYRHPFPATVWRKAVCLPSILYRLHSLLLAEELRSRIARETGLGRVNPSEDQDVFEPLRLMFPLQVQRAVSEDCSAPRKPRNGQRRRKRVRERKQATKSDAIVEQSQQDSSASEKASESKQEDDTEDDVDDINGDDADESAEPAIVNLRAATTFTCAPTKPDGEIHRSKLETLLKETKVIELNDEDYAKTGTGAEDENVFLPVENRTNVDKEYPETDSDAETVDSFEGPVRFFPSEDDSEVDEPSATTDQAVKRVTQRPYHPGPANILQALTMSCSGDFINLERMETIGDSFLKFVVTTHLFLLYPNAHEGKLSHLRSRIVCNSNLYRLGLCKNLPDRMISHKFSPGENWVPPGYVVREDTRVSSPKAVTDDENGSGKVVTDINVWSVDKSMDDDIFLTTKVHDLDKVQPIKKLSITHWDPKAPEVIKAQQIVEHSVTTIQQALPDKSIADCVEALIGCYLTRRGERSALRLLRWFGIDCLPSLDAHFRPKGAPWFPPPPVIPPTHPQFAQLNEASIAWRFDELQAQLNYTFRDPSLLIQAFTHPSYHQLRKQQSSPTTGDPYDDPISQTFYTDTDCYQRLEFLGDAVLDYVITRFLFEDSEQHSPGVLTDLRSALVNNNIFAALAVKFGLHRYLRASSPQLMHTIDVFVRYQKDVVKDDLDFITNEDIEIRVSDQSDPLPDEPAAGGIAAPMEPESELQTDSDVSECPRMIVPRVMDELEEEEAISTADAPTLEMDDDHSSTVQQEHDKQLVNAFVESSTDTNESPNIVSTEPADGTPDPVPPPANTINANTDDVEIPKVLGDIFESLAGAIFLDSNLSLDTVWAVFYPLMKERIERYTGCIPKSPVRQLLELEPERTKFERPRRTADGRILVCARVLGKGRFYGIGRNYRLAKSVAAKRALRVLKQLQNVTNRT